MLLLCDGEVQVSYWNYRVWEEGAQGCLWPRYGAAQYVFNIVPKTTSLLHGALRPRHLQPRPRLTTATPHGRYRSREFLSDPPDLPVARATCRTRLFASSLGRPHRKPITSGDQGGACQGTAPAGVGENSWVWATMAMGGLTLGQQQLAEYGVPCLPLSRDLGCGVRMRATGPARAPASPNASLLTATATAA